MSTAQPEASRSDEIRLIWTENGIVGFLIGLLCFPALGLLINNPFNVLANLVPEIVGIVITVGLIERANRHRDERNAEKQLQEQLVRDAGSTSNEVAKNAVHQLRKRGWLEREMSLLVGKDLQHANLSRGDLSFANLAGGELSRINLESANLSYTNLRRARLYYANLQGATLDHTTLTDAFLAGADLAKASLDHANLENVDFDFSDLRGSDISASILHNSSLNFVKIQGAKLTDAKLQGASLVGAELQGADLTRANLKGVSFEEVDFRAVFDETTILPDGTNWTPDTDMTRFTHPERHTQSKPSSLDK